jgi:hypothetical protein
MISDGEQLYRDLMRLLPDGMTANAWAVRAGVNRTIWADIRRHGNPSRRTLEKLLAAAGSSLAEFEALRVGIKAPTATSGAGVDDLRRGWRAAPLPPIPLHQCYLGGGWEGEAETLLIGPPLPGESIARPASLASSRQAYAFAYPGTAMRPRFRTGRVLVVSPEAAIVIGDDVLLTLADGRALIGEIIRRDASRTVLRQHAGPRDVEVPATATAALHRIAGEAI